jgi:hypothetical protein
VRTTVDLPDDVLERVRSVAADRRTSVSAVNPLPVSPVDGNILPRSATAITSRQWHIGR